MGIVACTTEPVQFRGSWILSGDEIAGYVRGEAAAGCRDGRVLVGLWGPHWGTPGVVAAEVEPLEGGGAWLNFALETGVATGRAALLIQGAEALLPLGG